jgi:hypothetical protein
VKTLSIAVLMAALALGGCSASVEPSDGPTDKPTGGYGEPANYTFEYTHYAGHWWYGTFRVTVRDHVPVAFDASHFHSELGTDESELPDWLSLDDMVTLDGLIERYNEAVEDVDWQAILEFDEDTGHPSSLYVEAASELVVDEEELYSVNWVSEYPFDHVAPPNYTFTYTYGAFSPLSGSYRVTVRDYVPVSFEVLDPYLEYYVDEGLIGLDTVLTLDDIVEMYLEASEEADRVSITWDEETGFPANVSVDQYEDAVDDEYGYTITDIVVE